MGCGHMGWLPYQLSVQIFRLSWAWRERVIPVGSKTWAGLHTKTDDVVRFVQDQVFYRALLTDSATSCLTDKESVPRGMPLPYGGGCLQLPYQPHRSLSLLQPEVVMNARDLFPCHKATCIGSTFSGPHSGCKPLQVLLVQSSSAACPQYVKGIPSCSMPRHHPGPSCGLSGVQRHARHHPGSASPGGLGSRFSILAAQAPHALSSA